MQTVRHILTIAIVFAMLASGLPLFSPEDANRDSRVDIMDAILLVKNLARTVEEPGGFSTSMEKAVFSLHMLAGLKTVIKPEGHKNNTSKLPTLDSPCLIYTYHLYLPLYFTLRYTEGYLNYSSITITPDPPPPRLNLFC